MMTLFGHLMVRILTGESVTMKLAGIKAALEQGRVSIFRGVFDGVERGRTSTPWFIDHHH